MSVVNWSYPLARELFDELAVKLREKASIQFTGTVPYFQPG